MSKNLLRAMTAVAACVFALTMAAEENVAVNSVRVTGPYAAVKPIMLDSVNKQGDKFNIESYLNKVTPGKKLLSGKSATGSLSDGEALPKLENQDAMVYLHFTLTNWSYFKGSLEVKGIKHHKVYIDGKAAGGELKLEPARHDVTIACLEKADATDTLRVKLKTTAGKAEINATGKRPYTLYDITDGLNYSGVNLSPSGKYAFVSYRRTYPNGAADGYTQLVEVETNRILQPSIGNASWLKDRDAFLRTERRNDVNLLTLTEVPSMQVTTLIEDIPSSIAVARTSPAFDYVLYTSNDYKGPRNAEFIRFNMPDDRLYNSLTHTFWHMYDLKAGVTRDLTFGKTDMGVQDISRDGDQIVFSSTRRDVSIFPFGRTSYYLYTLSTGQLDTLMTETYGINEMRFMPDGKSMIVTGDPTAFDGVGMTISKDKWPNTYDHQLYLYDLQSRKAKPLTRNFNPSVKRFDISASGTVYFTADNGSYVHLYTLNPQTGAIKRLNVPLEVVSNFSLAHQSETLAVYGSGSMYARRMVSAKIGKKGLSIKPLGTIDFEEEFKDVDIPRCESYKFLSSRGDSIDGFFYLPSHFDPAKKYPMLVYYYGGCTPTTRNLQRNYPAAVWAAMGYVVYNVNPSGCIGYGQEFSERHVNTWGHESGDDIIEGTKKFIADHPYVDGKRVGCLGASYGGFMTEYLLTKTDIYAAAVAHAGISDLTGYWGQGNWGYTYSQVATAKSYPWNRRDIYVDQSPLYNADKITTPLLLTQGSNDTNVPANQAWQLYTALKILNKPVEFIQVKNEDHVVVGYERQKEWQKTLIAWFAKWLQDDDTWWNELYKR